jgi:hypothetical protein
MNRPDTAPSASREYRRKLAQHDPARQARRTVLGFLLVVAVIGLALIAALVPYESFYPTIRSLLNRDK